MTYAVLTDAGFAKLREAGRTHRDGIDRLFERRFSDDEATALADLLGRLTSEKNDAPGCEPPD